MGLTHALPPWLAVCILSATFSISFASRPVAAEGLREAFETAWTRHPLALAREARTGEYAARLDAAGAFLPGPPALGGEHWTDAANRNEGFRKFAGEIAVPLWLPGQKVRAQAVVGAERAAYEGQSTLARLKLAGDVREAYWQARLAETEMALAETALESLAALESDVARRVKAGELARIDGNRALAEAQFQRIALAETRARTQRAHESFRALTGLSRLPADDEAAAPAPRPALDTHPALTAAAQGVEAWRARLKQVSGDTRDAPEIGIGTFRERSNFAAPWEQIVTFRVRIPLGNDHRNRPRIGAASAELAEAQGAQALTLAQLEAEVAGAEADRRAALAALPLAESRAALARDTHELVARGFKAGEFDLATRLRAEREFNEAQLARSRAVLDARRANSRLKQSWGLTP